ncbi:unnamed protein product [Cuscuta epithymum]|uniref:Uncharacterized protein n=1 Tax=Cuscuta epithymum TaxID=186058 RepID=A0AAV0CZQ2_9ASTE|nr:unnamed protein product [Cuscuta epithymum]
MSKKMKRVSMESSSYGGYEDARAREKHQALFQDFQELQMEINSRREKLDDAKKQKLILLAEVRFLRKRRSYLLQLNSMNRPQENNTLTLKTETNSKTETKSIRPSKKEDGPHKLPPLVPGTNPKQKGRMGMGKKQTALQDITPTLPPNMKHRHKRQKISSSAKQPTALPSLGPAYDSNHGVSKTHNGKDSIFHLPTQNAIDLNQNVRLLYDGNSAVMRGTHVPLFDLNQESSLSWKDISPPTRVPFDLNEISTEGEEPRWNFEPAMLQEETERSLMRGVNEDQHGGDLRISLCRNAGGEGTSRARKPKISWQDPVALRV